MYEKNSQPVNTTDQLQISNTNKEMLEGALAACQRIRDGLPAIVETNVPYNPTVDTLPTVETSDNSANIQPSLPSYSRKETRLPVDKAAGLTREELYKALPTLIFYSAGLFAVIKSIIEVK
jgi:hypothetical protein